jgi:hypothetical protein
VSSEEINRQIRERAARQRLIPKALRREPATLEEPKEQSPMNALIRKAAGRSEEADK